MIFSFAVGYSAEVLPHKRYFGFAGGSDPSPQFRFTTILAAYKPDSRERSEKLIKYHPTTAWEIITDAAFEALNREAPKKPAFLFRDIMEQSDQILFEEESKWFYNSGETLMFLPRIERGYPLIYL